MKRNVTTCPARLDTLYFHFYGLSREDAGYVLDIFPILRHEDKSVFGRYRTREMTLSYMNTLAGGIQRRWWRNYRKRLG